MALHAYFRCRFKAEKTLKHESHIGGIVAGFPVQILEEKAKVQSGLQPDEKASITLPGSYGVPF
jgi:hypothetical protein